MQHLKNVSVILQGNIWNCVFVFTKGQIFFIWVLVFSVSTNFSIHSYLLHKSKNKKRLYYHKDWEVSVMLYYFFWYNKILSRSFLIQLETTMQWLQKFEQKIICDAKIRRNTETEFCYCQDLEVSWQEHFRKFSKLGGVE